MERTLITWRPGTPSTSLIDDGGRRDVPAHERWAQCRRRGAPPLRGSTPRYRCRCAKSVASLSFRVKHSPGRLFACIITIDSDALPPPKIRMPHSMVAPDRQGHERSQNRTARTADPNNVHRCTADRATGRQGQLPTSKFRLPSSRVEW